MPGENVAEAARGRMRDFARGVFRAVEGPLEPVDAWIELLGRQIIDPAGLRDHAVPDIARVVPATFDRLEMPPPAGP